ncbi:hypothetical protein IG631_06362 [Alternaria alternata]|nr:hypothetical protein IG631_06362 [Alternaria alternata]
MRPYWSQQDGSKYRGKMSWIAGRRAECKMGYECRNARFSRQTRLKRLEQLSTNGRPESILRMIGRSAWLAE